MIRFLALLCLLALSPLQAVSIDVASARYLSTEQFQTVGEFLTGHPSDGPRLILHSQPGIRYGMYLILELSGDRSMLRPDSRVEIEMLRSDSKEIMYYHLPLGTDRVKRGVIYAGLTGIDWPDKKLQPMAWRVRLAQKDGSVLAEWKSFLWEKP